MEARRALRRGETTPSAGGEEEGAAATRVHLEEEQSSAETAAPHDVPMEDEVAVPPGLQLEAETPTEDWTAAQGIANSSQILRGGLDDMDGDGITRLLVRLVSLSKSDTRHAGMQVVVLDSKQSKSFSLTDLLYSMMLVCMFSFLLCKVHPPPTYHYEADTCTGSSQSNSYTKGIAKSPRSAK